MKTIGLLGGMSWESTVPYYRIINQTVNEHLGGLHSAQILLWSPDFQAIETLQAEGDWDRAGAVLGEAARALEGAGAEGLVLCTNTMHRVAPAIEDHAGVPLLHIADATGAAIQEAGVSTVGLLGTRFTMEEAFYRGRLEDAWGLRTLVPDDEGRGVVHRVIYQELCQGTIRDASREQFQQIIAGLAERGAEGVILGCTEISMLIGPDDVATPLFDTTEIHARRAAAWALEEDEHASVT